ncbi:type IIL restriction-modification enzyme MmeI [Sorangium sp. So ce321]|uniref:type IIL restriction-modification enzyme MmeI n=1 Tax=Sorangium sp. So ce321 TaxID=3133300 RepID=UPI003F61750A
MSDIEQRFHETWLGMVQPIDGLVVSIPVLVDAQCMERQPPETQGKLAALCPATGESEAGLTGRAIGDLSRFFAELLGFGPELFDTGDALPDELSLYVPEGKQTLRPTLALRKQDDAPPSAGADTTPASRAGARYEMLVWDLPRGLDLDRSEAVTGSWDYPPAAKLDRFLRHCRVPIGLLTNREVVRLIYAPHGESSGAITFKLDEMASVGGRPILDAFVMLLSASRFFAVARERALPALLAESRKRQANVTNELADQVFEALAILLRGFEAAAERDRRDLLDDALARKNDHLYKGLLTVLLRLVFLLYAEDRGLLPVEHPIYEKHFSVIGLFEQLQVDHGTYPDSMSRRFGAWGRLISVFRAIFLGMDHGTLHMPARRGSLFDPHTYPFLEGWGPAGSSPIKAPEAQADVRVPTIDDETVYRVLHKLLYFEGQRLSYRALDVEQIGSVYEALMGYHVVRVTADAVCMRPDRLWVTADEVLAVPAGRRAKWIKETIGLTAAQAEKLAGEIAGAGDAKGALEALAKLSAGGRKADPTLSRARALQLVLQPGTERRRTSSHYTPRSLSAPIVRRTLEPLLTVMGEEPASERLLELKICDPAMGSGAFLVEACRFLADHVVAAWTREGKLEGGGKDRVDPLMHARRLVAQKCLYGVDKNESAVDLAKLSLWLVTLARDLPFTFVDHALRHGDSLVGLDFDQIRSFHWNPGKQLELFNKELDAALLEAIGLRQQILVLANDEDPNAQREKERLLWDAQDALDRVRLIGDLVVGAFFAHEKEKERDKERERRLELVRAWLQGGGSAPEQLVGMQANVREMIPVFHWMVEFPEVFYVERPDPLNKHRGNRAASSMNAFLGNPPFLGKNGIAESNGQCYVPWLLAVHPGAHGNADLAAHFFRRADSLIGSHGMLGFIATNTIAQGDTRASGLQHLVAGGAIIYEATKSLPWPGQAAVAVSVVHAAKGTPANGVRARLDGVSVATINSRLRAGAERADPLDLQANKLLSLGGCFIMGTGFILSEEERERFVRVDLKNTERIFPLLGGEDLNTNPRQKSSRFVIDFGDASLREASEWPALVAHLEATVKPARAGIQRRDRRDAWWLFASRVPQLKLYFKTHERALVVCQTSANHAIAFLPRGPVVSNTLVVFLLDASTAFALLQSRIHGLWARLLSASMKMDLRYMPTDCFETFPFPQPDPRTVIPSLEAIGERLYTTRAAYMLDENVGLTITYNRLKDPGNQEHRILELRRLHEKMDRAVLDAYGWTDVEVPPYCPPGDDDKKKLERFEDEVIDRLFVLNAKRAEEEKLKGLASGAKQKGASKGPAKKAPKKKTDMAEGQVELRLLTEDDES